MKTLQAKLSEWGLLAVVAAGAASFLVLFFQVRDQQTQVRRQAAQGRQALVALCAFKHDLENRIFSSRQFLHDHPAGIPGVPTSLLRNAIRIQEGTLTALHLDC